MNTLLVARNAMATRFEIVLQGENTPSLRATGEEALDEIERLDAQLSLYNPSSELSQLNALASTRPVRVEPGLFSLLQWACTLSRETQGAFDASIAPLMQCWGFMEGSGRMPAQDEIEAARNRIGMNHVVLDENSSTVYFEKPGMMLDLGAIGKGYAVERAAQTLRESGMDRALIHGGTSTVQAIGSPQDSPAWRIGIGKSDTAGKCNLLRAHSSDDAGQPELLAVLSLKDESLSVSAVWGKAFMCNNRLLGHVIDPRSGQPVTQALLAAVVLPSATETDAFSTALLVLGREGIPAIPKQRSGMRWLVAGEDDGAAWTKGNL